MALFPLDELPSTGAVGARVAMETVVIVAIGVLATIFLASFVALVVVCRHRYCHPHDLLHHFDSKSVNQHKASKSMRHEFLPVEFRVTKLLPQFFEVREISVL